MNVILTPMYNTGVTPVPLELPLRPAEAAELAHLIFDQAERKSLTGEVRNRLAARARVLRLSTITPYFGSLGRDPVHPSAYYLAVDGEHGVPHLLYIALANAPAYQHPRFVWVLDRLPLASTNKIDRAALRRMAVGRIRRTAP